MNGASQPQAQREKDVIHELKELEECCIKARTQSQAVYERLTIAMREIPPRGIETKVLDNPLSPLANDIKSSRVLVESVIETLETLLNHLEI